MTIEEKRTALKELCKVHEPFCWSNGECPLFRNPEKHNGCVEDCDDATIEHNYYLAFGEDAKENKENGSNGVMENKKNWKDWEPCVGDRVVSVRGVGNEGKVGVYGTIRRVNSEDSFCVDFDEDIGGHDGDGATEKNCGWWCARWDVDLVDSLALHVTYPIITIQTDGKTTTATLREGHKILNTAKAVCCEEDEFDYLVGAKIALERVMGEEEKQEEKKFEIGMRVKDIDYCFDEAWVTLINEGGSVFITPPDMMGDVLRNGAKEHENCYCIDPNYKYTTILEDKEG